MQITSLNSIGGISGVGGTENANTAMGREAFLSMLVSQLKNQDPLSPMEGTDFTAQLAQFSSLEQMLSVNKNLEGLQLIQTSQNNAMMTNMIGKVVEARGNDISLKDGNATDVAFNVDVKANVVDVFVYDSNGNIVRKIVKKDVNEGDNIVSWDGKDNNGGSLADGRYSYSVSAKDSSGDDINSSVFMKGEITSVSYNEDGSTSIWMGGLKISLGQIIKISKS